jgi:HK97 gp10 family phage protein
MAGRTGVTIKVKSNRLPAISAEMKPKVSVEVKKAGFDIQSGAQERAAVRTGTMRRSITSQLSNDGLTATVGPSVEYSKYVEFGARGRAARPFMRPAAEAVLPKFAERLKAVLRGLN